MKSANEEHASTSEPVIKVEGLRKSFGSHVVLKDIDFTVMPGEVVTIIGASGSGKSTLLRCINLLEIPDAGHVWFHGKDLAAQHVDVNKLREKIGMVFQGFNLFNNMNVLDNCTLAPVTLKKMDKAEAESVAMGHLRSVGLEEFAKADVNTLSGGQKQRVAIARALCMRPDLMLFDEPTSALDPEIVGEVLGVMRDPRQGRDDHGGRHARDGLREERLRQGRLHGSGRHRRGGLSQADVHLSQASEDPGVPLPVSGGHQGEVVTGGAGD
jgi:ABC-type polar amino acid transport system ATPase subunit